MINKQSIGKYLLAFAAGCLAMFLLLREEKTDVEVPINFDIETPEITKETDTVFLPRPIRVPGPKQTIIDSTYYDEYVKLKDSIARDSLFKEAITINTYNERIEDDTLKIDLYMKTRGTLLEYQAGYTVKPQTITIDTTLTVPIPTKSKFFVGGEVVLPQPGQDFNASIKPGIMMVNKKSSKIYKVSYDPINKVYEGGIFFRF